FKAMPVEWQRGFILSGNKTQDTDLLDLEVYMGEVESVSEERNKDHKKDHNLRSPSGFSSSTCIDPATNFTELKYALTTPHLNMFRTRLRTVGSVATHVLSNASKTEDPSSLAMLFSMFFVRTAYWTPELRLETHKLTLFANVCIKLLAIHFVPLFMLILHRIIFKRPKQLIVV
ncbi:MAG: hypothetical protein ACREOZ_04545, partial [Gloeomargaritales cyanobacterium]